MRERLGLKAIDAVSITHMLGDHVVGAPYVREKWGAKLWTPDRVAFTGDNLFADGRAR